MIERGPSGAPVIDYDSYLSDDGKGIKIGALMSTIGAAIGLMVTGVWIRVIESYVAYNVGLINGFGEWLSGLVKIVLGESAALMVDGWRAAFVQAVQFGPFAPFIMAGEAVLVLLIIFALWDRRPYG